MTLNADQVIAEKLDAGDWQAVHSLLVAREAAGIADVDTVAATLIPLASHIPVAETVSRARFVLVRGAGTPGHAEAVVRVAEVLAAGSLIDEALALLSHTEAVMDDPAAMVDVLAPVLTRLAVTRRAGHPLPRFATRRWQREVGTHPARCTVADLAKVFGPVEVEPVTLALTETDRDIMVQGGRWFFVEHPLVPRGDEDDDTVADGASATRRLIAAGKLAEAHALASFLAGQTACGDGEFTQVRQVGVHCLRLGRLVEALGALQHCERMLDTVDDPEGELLMNDHWLRIPLLARLGRMDEAIEYARDGADRARAEGRDYYYLKLRGQLVTLLVDMNRHAEALEEFHATTLRTPTGPRPYHELWAFYTEPLRAVGALAPAEFITEWEVIFGQLRTLADEWIAHHGIITPARAIVALLDEQVPAFLRDQRMLAAVELTGWAASFAPALDEAGAGGAKLWAALMRHRAQVLAANEVHDQAAVILEAVIARGGVTQEVRVVVDKLAASGDSHYCGLI